MLDEKLFPTILMILDVLAAGHNFYAGDPKRGVYWIAASVLTYCVTF